MKWRFYPAAEFDQWAVRWGACNARGSGTQLLDPGFVAPLLREFATRPTRIAVKGDPAHPEAMALVEREGWGRWRTFQPSQAPLGALVCAPDTDIPRLLAELLGAIPGLALVFGLTQQDPNLLARPAEGPALRTLDYIPTARILITGTFEEYWASRGRNLRKNLQRRRNLLERAGITARLETLTDPADAGRGIEDYGRLESAGWKAGTGTAIHPDNPQGRFYRSMLEHFMARGEARVWRYWYGEKLVASDLCIHRDGVLIILKTTYDESENATSPAHLMRHEAFQELFASGRFTRIEFYGRAMDWHRKWSDDIRTMYHATAYRFPLLRRFLERRARPDPGDSVPEEEAEASE